MSTRAARTTPASARFSPYEGTAAPARIVPSATTATSLSPVAATAAAAAAAAASSLPVAAAHSQPAWDLPFSELNRCAQNVWVRNMHRPLQQHLVTSRCHWVERAPGLEMERSYTTFVCKAGEGELLQAPEEEEEAEKDGAPSTLMCALLVSGMSPDPTQHPLRRITFLLRASSSASAAPTFYSTKLNRCVTDPGTDTAAKEGLSASLAAQAGLSVPPQKWSPFLELIYRGGNRTVFMVAEGLGAEVAAAGTAGADGAVASRPVKAALADILDYKVLPEEAANRSLNELMLAADAYDQSMTRDATWRILTHLRAAVPEYKRCRDEAESAREAALEQKKRRGRELEALRVARCEKEKKLKAQWKLDDEGKTDRQKRELNETRKELLKQFADEPKLPPQPEQKVTVEEKLVKEKGDLLACFQYLDRPQGTACGTGTIPRARLAGLLLCLGLPELRNLKQVEQLFSFVVPRGSRIPYPAICSEIVPADAENEVAR